MAIRVKSGGVWQLQLHLPLHVYLISTHIDPQVAKNKLIQVRVVSL